MTYVLAAIAQLLHIALMLAAAPLVPGLQRWIEARLAGRTGPVPWQPWREFSRLIRKQPVLAENASALQRMAPTVCVAASIVAVSLVPSFTLGMAFAPLSDLLVLTGLLAAARGALALAALGPGTAQAGLAAGNAMSLACLAEPVLFLVVFTLGLLGGTTNLDLLVGQQHQGMAQPAAAALTAAALITLALASPDDSGQTTEAGGVDLASLRFAETLRHLVWLDLIGALFLPFGIAEQGSGPLSWCVGLLALGVKLAVLVAGVAAVRCATGRPVRARAPQMVGVAAVLGLLAAALVLASAVAT